MAASEAANGISLLYGPDPKLELLERELIKLLIDIMSL